MTELKEICRQVRIDIIRMLHEAGSGHPGGSLSEVEILVALYFKILKHNPKKPDSKDRDYFFMSKGHCCPGLYSVLAHAGYFPVKELMTLRKFGSRLQGHPHRGSLPGIENASGPLGMGLSQALGAALALRLDKKPNRVYCLLGDGELDEGNIWEAAMSASHFNVSNIIAIVDRNHVQLSGTTEEIMRQEPLAEKWKAFGWEVHEINGHDIDLVISTIKKAQSSGKPVVIIANTIKGKGVSFMEGKAAWHGVAPDDEQAKQALKELENG